LLEKKIDLGFNLYQTIRVREINAKELSLTKGLFFDEYIQLTKDITREIAAIKDLSTQTAAPTKRPPDRSNALPIPLLSLYYANVRVKDNNK
jgi:hypothetical protein